MGCPKCGCRKYRSTVSAEFYPLMTETCAICNDCESIYAKVISKWMAIPTLCGDLFTLFLAGFTFYEYWFLNRNDWQFNFTMSWWGQLTFLALGICLLWTSVKLLMSGGETIRLISEHEPETCYQCGSPANSDHVG